MNKTTRTTLKAISTLIVVFVVSFAFLLVGIKIFGIEIYAVLSGSMEPTYKVGSLIYVVNVDTDELKVKDAITFKIGNDTIATHRIIDIKEENGKKTFQTKGDANDKPDERLVEENEIIGKPIFTIPLLGYISKYMQTQYGMLTTLGIAIALIIVVVIIDVALDDKKKEKQENN